MGRRLEVLSFEDPQFFLQVTIMKDSSINLMNMTRCTRVRVNLMELHCLFIISLIWDAWMIVDIETPNPVGHHESFSVFQRFGWPYFIHWIEFNSRQVKHLSFLMVYILYVWLFINIKIVSGTLSSLDLCGTFQGPRTQLALLLRDTALHSEFWSFFTTFKVAGGA